MSDKEQLIWWRVLATEWGLFLFFALFLAIAGTDKGKTVGVEIVAWIAVGFTALYLLILSWRAAYLAGRGPKR